MLACVVLSAAVSVLLVHTEFSRSGEQKQNLMTCAGRFGMGLTDSSVTLP